MPDHARELLHGIQRHDGPVGSRGEMETEIQGNGRKPYI